MRVLISAYACEPGKGSEPGVGWNWTQQIAKYNDVWVLTRDSNRTSIEAATDSGPNVHWVYLDLPRWARWWKRGQRGVHLYYYLWQILAYLKARQLHRSVCFDVVHHITFVNYWVPSFLALLPVPFIWGPVGGGECAPPAFRRRFTLRGKVYEILRDAARALGAMDPFTRLTARRAAVSFSTTEDTRRKMCEVGCKTVFVFSEAGMSSDEIRTLGQVSGAPGRTVRVLSVGRLLHWKGFDIGLRGFARFHHDYPDSVYWLAGEGPERARLEKLSAELGVTDAVVFCGKVPRERVLRLLGEAHILLHPSLHDSGGWACLEGMAAGVPVVCFDLGGPGIQVSETSGIKVPATTPEEAIPAIAGALTQLSDPLVRAQLGQGGQRRVADSFHWDKKGEFMNSIYRQIAARQPQAY